MELGSNLIHPAVHHSLDIFAAMRSPGQVSYSVPKLEPLAVLVRNAYYRRRLPRIDGSVSGIGRLAGRHKRHVLKKTRNRELALLGWFRKVSDNGLLPSRSGQPPFC